MKKIRICKSCSSYTLQETHCSQQTKSVHPVRFNPNDPYGDYRRKARLVA